MSKVIKGLEEPPLTPYDFRVLTRGNPSRSFPAFSTKGGSLSWNGRHDNDLDPGMSFNDVEAVIQNRLLELERKAQEIEEEAYAKGYAQGEKDGYEVGKKSILIVKDRIEKLLAGLEDLPRRAFKDYRDWFLFASLAMARKIVGIELSTQPQALIPLVDELLDEAEAHQSLTLFLNPKDLELLAKNMDVKKWPEETRHAFHLRTDSSLERGGCRIESDIQHFDATLETRFSLLEQTLRNEHSPGQD
ncbi:MAG: hypothetical protein HGA84_07740 [Syntrophobacteraceae bacterium]|nr:hypothetical protein [Syntrophobacteraceae bacterium]